MTTPSSANEPSKDSGLRGTPISDSASAIADLQFWIDHPSLDDLTAAQLETDRQRVRLDVEECIRLLQAPTNRLVSNGDSVDGNTSLPSMKYSFCKVLGVGAFGVVLHAKDQSLHRDVALKILRPSVLLSKEARDRFTIECQALARCNCVGIVPIHEVGYMDGHPFLAMGLVPGMTLADFIKSQQSPIDPSLAARIVAEIAFAVHQAHQRGILHRDLKPSNVLLQIGEHSKSDLPFTPFVSDFGLAKDILPDSRQSAGSFDIDSPIIGTVRYMSPEQASGRNREVSAASDVFSLGVILYELLTLECPFQGETTFAIIQQVVNTTAPSPRRLNKKVTRDLDAIVRRCLSKLSSERYPSAGELAEDLHRFLNGKPVVAKRSGPAKSTILWAKRNPALALATTIIWCGLLLSTTTISLLYRNNLRNLQIAIEASQREDAARRFALTSMDKTLRYLAETSLQNVPQTLSKKLDLHLQSLKTNEEYAELRKYDEESRYRLSISHHYVANDAFNCNQFELSLYHRNRCLEILSVLAREAPRNAIYQFDLFMNRFLMYDTKLSLEERQTWLMQSRDHLLSAMSLSPNNPDWEEADAGICSTIGHNFFDSGQKKDSAEWLTLAINTSIRLGNEFPDRPHYYKHALGGYHGLARIGRKESDWPAVCKHCEQALNLVELHFHKSRDLADILDYTLSTLVFYAQAMEQIDPAKSLSIYDRLISEALKIEKLEPKFQFYQVRRAAAHLSQAEIYRQLGNLESSQKAFDATLKSLENFKPILETHERELEILNSRIKAFQQPAPKAPPMS